MKFVSPRDIHIKPSGNSYRILPVISLFFVFFRDVSKAVKAQALESAKAEERLLNMDFVKAKTKELSNRRERAEVRS